ncbi:MAG: phosphatase [Gammaproteobacteria bacterium]|nr:MAG: phosphatase [Gammaproteobacteria bacterium]
MVFRKPRGPSPNQIDTVPVPGSVGCLGLFACPGTRIEPVATSTGRLLAADLAALADWGANGVVSLIEPHEFTMNKVEVIPRLVRNAGMWWLHLPIIDMDIPDQAFEDRWAVEGERIRHALRIGERVALHCYAGLGRTGMIGARLLVELGETPDEAVKAVRRDNRRRIQTREQLDFVRSCTPL